MFYILINISLYSYFKYLIEFKYYYPLDILFIFGIMNLIIFSITFSINLFYQYLKDENILIFQFYNFYTKFGVWSMINSFLFGLFFIGFLIGIFNFITYSKLCYNRF